MQRASTFGPLRHPLFALLMVGVLFGHLGNTILAVGASWQLTQTGEPADIVALVQTALTLPMLMLALPAGAWADMHDRRRIILGAIGAMLAVSVLLLALAAGGTVPTWAIITLTALIACGVAGYSPATGASIRATVPAGELAAAVAFSILVFNTARSAGPAIGGAIVAAGGAKAAFLANAACYALAMLAYLRWKPEPQPPVARRPLASVVAEGLQAAWASREIRTILLRAMAFTVTGAAAWGLMPLVAARLLHAGPSTYGLLLGSLGLGAVIGAASATWFRRRFRAEILTNAAGLIYGAAIIVISLRPGPLATMILLVIGGAGWVQALSGFSVAAQLWAPQAVVGRVVAMASAVTYGGIAVGSWLWGHYAEWSGVAGALGASGGAMIVLPVLGLLLPMPAHEAPPST
jgi:MFS family permease